MNEITPIIIKAKTYTQGFGQFPCSACGKRTSGKLADYVTLGAGGYYDNCVPLCSKCYRRVTKAAAEARLTMEGAR
jgi:hypothetical protein